MKNFAFRYEVEDDHLDNCLFLLLLIAIKCPKAIKKPYNLKTYISYFSEMDLTNSRILNDNNGLKLFFDHLKKGKSFRVANNIKLEMNKEFYKRIYFYKHDWRNIIFSSIFLVLFIFCFITSVFFGAATIKHFSSDILLFFLIFIGCGLVSLFLFVKFYGKLVSSVNLTNRLFNDKILYLFSKTIPIKMKTNKITFKYLPISKKAIIVALEKERQELKKNKPIIIEKVIEKHFIEQKLVREIIEREKVVEVEKLVEVEKIVEVEKEIPQVFNEIDITSNEYMKSNEQLQQLFNKFPKFEKYYPLLCSEELEKWDDAFIIYSYKNKCLQWTGDEASLVYLFFSICDSKSIIAEKDYEPIVQTFVNAKGKKFKTHQLKVAENNDGKTKKLSKATSVLADLLEKKEE